MGRDAGLPESSVACRRSPGGAGGGPERGAVAQRGSAALRARARGCARRARACWREPRSRAGAVSGRQAGSGSARSRARAAAQLPSPGPALREVQGPAPGRVGEPSGESEVAPPERPGRHDSLAEPEARRPAGEVVARSPAPRARPRSAAKRPEGRWFSPTPYLRSRIAFSISACRRWSASSSIISPARSLMKAW